MSVDPAYRHQPKRARPGAPIGSGASELKWYHIAFGDRPIAPNLAADARSYLAALRGTIGLDADRGFAILHRCGADFYFLLVCVWRGSNELWEAVHYRDAGMTTFAPFDPAYPPAGALRPTFCVWELGVVMHEAGAWTRYLSSSRGANDSAAWRHDLLDGSV